MVKLVANGGAGSSGGGNGADGTSATDPDPTTPTQQQGFVANVGGPGFAGSNAAANGVGTGDGGGGGGGGAGYIQASHQFADGNPIASPTVQLQ
jgi:hypothetical protein